jgi:hypothetical protein
MKTFYLALDFSADENELTSPVARIYLAGKFPKEGDPFNYLSPDCAFASELDEAIDYLKGELEKIREEGHRKFDAERRKRATRN